MEINFCFEEWAFLAMADPEAFEIRRKETIDGFLMKSKSRQRLLGVVIQDEIDFERKRARDTQEAFQVIARMLCEHLSFLGEEMIYLSEDINTERRDCSGERPF